jgi:DNA-binding transcriptional ArsR family regulator
MSFGTYLELTDPKVIRAIAHPTRTQILHHLMETGPSTATECAAVVEESPSACSYHLRKLAEFGFVEQVETQDGRERRWQAVVTGFGVPKAAQDRPEILAALRPLTRRWFQDNQEVIAEFLATEPRFDPTWRKAATFQQTNPYVTPDELIRIGEEIQEVLRPYQERDRLEGAERVYATFVAVPWPVKRRTRAASQKTGKGKKLGRR